MGEAEGIAIAAGAIAGVWPQIGAMGQCCGTLPQDLPANAAE